MPTIRNDAVKAGGAPMTLVGDPLVVGQKAPEFETIQFVLGEGFTTVRLADTPRAVRLFSIVPSLDTPVCADQTRRFSQELASFGDAVATYTVSVDTPFAQNRFCGAEAIENMQTLSDYKDRSLGTSWGLLIDESKLLARAVVVLDPDDTIAYVDAVADIFDHPDYGAAIAALASAVERAGA